MFKVDPKYEANGSPLSETNQPHTGYQCDTQVIIPLMDVKFLQRTWWEIVG